MTTATAPAPLNKLPRTNTKAFRAALRSYLADATEVEGNDNATEDERIAYMIERLRSEYGWRIEVDGVHSAAHGWLQGLALHTSHYYGDIVRDTLIMHGMDPATEVTDRLWDAITDNWWTILALGVVREYVAAGYR